VTTDDRPVIALKNNRLDIKVERIIRIKNAPETKMSELGETFAPTTATVVEFNNRAHVRLTGRAVKYYSGYAEFRSRRFNLYGYPSYAPCPAWLVPIIREAGYRGWLNENPEEKHD
jgi:hypothetical protein